MKTRISKDGVPSGVSEGLLDSGNVLKTNDDHDDDCT